MITLSNTPDSLTSAKEWVNYSGALASTNNIKLSIATSASPATYTGVALDGAGGNGVSHRLPRSITVTSTAHNGSYTIVSPIVITGLDALGNTITDNLQLTLANGGETIVGTKPIVQVTQIVVPAQVDTLGHFVFGVQDVFCVKPPRQIRIATAGNLKCLTESGRTETITGIQASEKLDISPSFIFGDSGTTAQDITLLF